MSNRPNPTLELAPSKVDYQRMNLLLTAWAFLLAAAMAAAVVTALFLPPEEL
jgi:hypothetical protein